MFKSYWLIGYHRKETYQRNFLVSALMVYVPIILGSVYYLLSATSDDRLSRSDGTRYGPLRVLERGAVDAVSQDARYEREKVRAIWGRSYSIIGDSRSRGAASPTFVFPSVFSIDSLDPELADEISVGNDFGSGSGGGDGISGLREDMRFGLPDASPYMPLPRGIGGNEFPFDHPAIIRVSSPAWPSGAPYSDTGKVRVLLSISDVGDVSWKFVEIEPLGFGFARVVENSLVQGEFIPAKRHGRKVSTIVVMYFEICRECDSEVMATGQDISASLLPQFSGR